MAEDDGPTFAPVLVVDLYPVAGSNCTRDTFLASTTAATIDRERLLLKCYRVATAMIIPPRKPAS